MAIKINFDSNHNAQLPTLILATKSGKRIHTLPAYDIKVRDSFASYSTFEFKVNHADCNIKSKQLWRQITDFKLVYCREFNLWFEIYVNVNESNHIEKAILAKSLGEAELSQIYLNSVEINTEDDISREDYEPTILYNKDNPKSSLLDRITEKAPNYKIVHVDSTIANIQRTFSFDGKTILDALNEIEQEINCLICTDVVCDADGIISREIKVYDLESNCVDCGYRGEFDDTCPKCGSSNVLSGYGDDTTVFVSTQNLADSIKYSTDADSVKNCFRLLAGDNLMTATIASCNPNGSGYIWYISDKLKEDMSPELVEKLNQYDEQYEYYQKLYQIDVPSDILSKYNAIVEKYSEISKDIQKMPSRIIGYPSLMNIYYNTIDLYLLLNHNLMPEFVAEKSSAQKEAEKLTYANLSPVSVQDIDKVSVSTATNAVLAMAKVLVDTTRYQVKVKESSMDGELWTGVFTVKSYTDEEDIFETNAVNVVINDDYGSFVKQKLDKALSNTSDDKTDVVSLFALSYDDFAYEIRQYSLSRLTAFHDACQVCLDILIEQGISDKKSLIGQNAQLYSEIYEPMYNKLFLIEDEIKLREAEIAVVAGKYDTDGELLQNGMQSVLDNEKATIQVSLNMQKYLGEDLWSEFVNYRREDTYQNDNYISDGLNNAELFERALEFIEVAKKEIYKSATLQHTISATMKNLLVMKEFVPLVDHFEVGNWIRIRVDNDVYKLRLIEYQVDYKNLSNITVAFSDIKMTANGLSDLESIASKAASMATSYGAVTRQASQGKKSNQQLDAWVTKGLALTNMKIVSNADNQNITLDSHGLLCKEYLPILDSYDDKQLKIINRGLYLTDDNWRTSRAGIGDFTFYNPMTGKVENSYGVIADTLIGSLILSEKVGIYNTQNSITLDEKGLVITATGEEDEPRMMFTVRKKMVDSDGNISYLDHLYLDENGNLVINGTIKIQSQSGTNSSSLNDISKKVDDAVDNISSIQNRIDGFNGLHFYIRYSEYEDGREMTVAPNSKTMYMGSCSTDQKTAPTDPSQYTWVKVKGDDGTPGVNGTSSYLHIKYSNDGTTFTENNGETLGDWIGTCITEAVEDPTDFDAYEWKKIRGEDGKDGITYYTWIKYADTPTSGMSDNPEGKVYIGIAQNKTSKQESDNYEDYTWSLIKGDNGIDGLNSATIFLYKRSDTIPNKPNRDITYTFATGMLSDTDGWSVAIPAGVAPCYVTQATAIANTETDVISSAEWSTPEILAQNGSNGNDGAHGMNTAVIYLYKRSDNAVAIDWTTDLIYSFANKSIVSDIPSGWSDVIPNGTEALYVTAATASNTEDTDTIAYTEWSTPVVLAKNGIDGDNGTDGLNSATVFLYKRSDTIPNKPSKSIVYTFSTGTVTDADGWSVGVPSGTAPCYVIQATAASRSASDTIEPTEWTVPIILAQNGQDGKDGNDGEHGMNTAVVYLYKRSATVASVDWSNDLTYSFVEKALVTIPTGWSNTIPDGTNPLYVTAATATSATETDTIAYTEWSAPVVLAKNGANGSNGANGLNTATVYLYKRSETAPSKPTKAITYTFAGGNISDADGWEVSIPSGTSPCYVIQATAVSSNTTDIIEASEWTAPVIMAQNGEDGLNGRNNATVYLYKRSESNLSIDWTSSLTYTFSTGKLNPIPDGWSQNVPDGKAPLFVTAATASSIEDTDSIASNEWSTPVVMAANGTQGQDGKTYYTWVKYADDVNGTNMSDDPTDKEYIGLAYNKETAEESTNPADYKWTLFRGKDGVNGTSSYFYIRYSENANGNPMTIVPTENTKYMGVCSTDSEVAPTSYTEYKWSQCKGNDGIGTPGKDGKTQYLHIKYSNDGTTFTENNGEDLGAYIGTLVDFNEADSEVFSDYTWKKFTEDVDEELNEIQNQIKNTSDSLNETIQNNTDRLYETIKQESIKTHDSIANQIDAANSSIIEQVKQVSSEIDSKYAAIIDDVNAQLAAHKAEIGQYMLFNDDGLTLGATSSTFKTIIDNVGMYFKQGDIIVSYVNNNQLHIPNAVIENTLILGNFFFSPRTDGGVSFTWQE